MRTLIDASQQNLTQTERWHLDSFRKWTSNLVAGYFYDEFWQRLVHQVSEDQPAVSHAAIAISARHVDFEQKKSGQRFDGEESSLVLQQCNKAITGLQQHLGTGQLGRSHKEVVLVTCVMLITLALFQGDVYTAGCHLQSGDRLFIEWEKNNFDNSSAGPILKKAFAQLHLHWSTFANPKDFIRDDHPSIPCLLIDDRHAFSALSPEPEPEPPEILEKVSELTVMLGWLVLQSHPQGFGISTSRTFPGKGEVAVLSNVRQFRGQLKASEMLGGEAFSQRDQNTLMLMNLWSEVLYTKIVIAQNSPDHPEYNYEDPLPHFRRAIYLAALSVSYPTQHSSFRAGIIPAIFFCGFHCRDWHVRQEALRLLHELQGCDQLAQRGALVLPRRRKRQEDILTTSATALVLERLIGIESEGIEPGETIPQSAYIDSMCAEMQPDAPGIQIWYYRPGLSGLGNIVNENQLWETELLPYASPTFLSQTISEGGSSCSKSNSNSPVN
ncbi:hypothetical protein NUU61_007443 [Penicillium alfredii]|uniref:Transcription factor domain-containing protein n=1 Tax=Penicillium alfredii TaxID=1506179 RepID=A0A9W9F2Q6_9EURO|nr:uncharacterized protein NUU61_007443 [Penicillium alfredii]KAJ5092573.1 hypothetical protein NUU61_007443 [Penicillium alfredii]